MPGYGPPDSSCVQPSAAFTKNGLRRGLQANLDPGSAAVGRLHEHRAAPLLRQLTNDGQAQAGPTLGRGPSPEEPIGDPVSLVGVDAGPDVLDGEEGSSIGPTRLDHYRPRPVRHRVVDQVVHDLVEVGRLAEGTAALAPRREGGALARGAFPPPLESAMDRIVEVDLRRAALLDPPWHHQQPVHDSGKAVDLVVGRLELAADL